MSVNYLLRINGKIEQYLYGTIENCYTIISAYLKDGRLTKDDTVNIVTTVAWEEGVDIKNWRANYEKRKLE